MRKHLHPGDRAVGERARSAAHKVAFALICPEVGAVDAVFIRFAKTEMLPSESWLSATIFVVGPWFDVRVPAPLGPMKPEMSQLLSKAVKVRTILLCILTVAVPSPRKSGLEEIGRHLGKMIGNSKNNAFTEG